MKNTSIIVALVGVVVGALMVGSTSGQTSTSTSSTSPGVQQPATLGNPPQPPATRSFPSLNTNWTQSTDPFYPSDGVVFNPNDGVVMNSNKIGELMNQLRHSDDSAKKADLMKQLETAVTKFFDEDLKSRETDLAKLEERLNKLRTQLDRRRTAKAEIIQLQLKVLANDAEGLGFSSRSDFERQTSSLIPPGATPQENPFSIPEQNPNSFDSAPSMRPR
jgi:hypothetical protein